MTPERELELRRHLAAQIAEGACYCGHKPAALEVLTLMDELAELKKCRGELVAYRWRWPHIDRWTIRSFALPPEGSISEPLFTATTRS